MADIVWQAHVYLKWLRGCISWHFLQFLIASVNLQYSLAWLDASRLAPPPTIANLEMPRPAPYYSTLRDASRLAPPPTIAHLETPLALPRPLL